MQALLVLAQSAPTLPSQIWPTSIVGYVTLLIALLALASTLVAWGRVLEKLNGWGRRVTDLEGNVKQLTQQVTDLNGAVGNTLRMQGELMKEIGGAVQKAEVCDDAVRDLGIDLGAKMDELRRSLERELHTMDKAINGLTRELSAKGVIQGGR